MTSDLEDVKRLVQLLEREQLFTRFVTARRKPHETWTETFSRLQKLVDRAICKACFGRGNVQFTERQCPHCAGTGNVFREHL